MQLFISHLASWLRTRRFSEPTFRPSGATNHWKNTVFRDFPTFSRICIFFLLIFSLLTLLTSAFQLSILSEVSLLNFLRIMIYTVYIYICTGVCLNARVFCHLLHSSATSCQPGLLRVVRLVRLIKVADRSSIIRLKEAILNDHNKAGKKSGP